MRFRVLLSLSLLLAAAPRVAIAQTASELVAARALFTEGVDLEKKKDYAGALEKFRRVASIKSTAIVRYHEGFCAEKLGRWVDALDAYARAGIDGQGDPKQKDAVDAAKKAEASLRPRVPKIHTKVTGSQKGKYEIKIDGVQVSPVLIDAAVPVDVGKHVIELSGEGIASDSQEVTVGEKETKEVVFAAKDPATTPPPPPKDDKKPPPKDDKPPPPPPPPKDDKPPPPPPADPRAAPKLAIVVGFGIGNIMPGGKMVDENTGNMPRFAKRDGATSNDQLDYFGPGLAIEPMVGFRFLRPLHAYLAWQHGFLSDSGNTKGKDFSASTDAIGLGVALNTHPSGPFGIYLDVFIASRTTHYNDRTSGETASFSGSNLRLKGGVAYKPTPTLTILGFAFASAGSYTSFKYDDASAPTAARDEAIDLPKTHTFIGLGVGATYDITLAK
jgi:hypothetical protein